MIFWYKEYEAPISERIGKDMQSRALRNVVEILSKFGWHDMEDPRSEICRILLWTDYRDVNVVHS